MLKAVLIDDEQHCIDRLQKLLLKYNDLIIIVDCFSSIDDAKEGIEKINPDVIFLDIELNEFKGFDLLRGLKKINFQTIFTTAHNKYAIEAIKFSAFDYLMKPISDSELEGTINRLNEKSILSRDLSMKMNALLHNVSANVITDKKMVVATEKETFFLDVSEIIRCQADSGYTHIHLKNGKTITASKTLKCFEELLVGSHFFRTHQSHLINLKWIKKYNKVGNGSITMIDNSIVDISKRRKKDFTDKIGVI